MDGGERSAAARTPSKQGHQRQDPQRQDSGGSNRPSNQTTFDAAPGSSSDSDSSDEPISLVDQYERVANELEESIQQIDTVLSNLTVGAVQETARDAKLCLVNVRSILVSWGCDIRIKTHSLDHVKNTGIELVIKRKFDSISSLLLAFRNPVDYLDHERQSVLLDTIKSLRNFINTIRMSQAVNAGEGPLHNMFERISELSKEESERASEKVPSLTKATMITNPMTVSDPGQDERHPMADFDKMLRYCTKQGSSGESYVLVEEFKNWLKSERSGSGMSQAERLFDDIYGTTRLVSLPTSMDMVWESLLVFSILLVIGCGKFIDRFHRHRIVDKQLPIDLLRLRSVFETLEVPNAEILAQRFDEKQWAFCPVKFHLLLGQDFVKQQVIPICSKDIIDDNGTATLYHIAVQEEFVGQDLQQVARASRYNDAKDDFGWRYRFALKTFRESKRNDYEKEVNNLLALHREDSMIRFFADYGHHEISTERNTLGAGQGEDSVKSTYTYNILFEPADMDLEEYFKKCLPPVLQAEVQLFWGALFEIANAVRHVHGFEKRGDDGNRTHQGQLSQSCNISLKNVLTVDGKFKLADPGLRLSEIAGAMHEDLLCPPEISLVGVPNLREPVSPFPLSPASDIWALGCLFSIAATWVVLGYQGVLQFDRIRQKAEQQRTLPQEDRAVNFQDGVSVGILRDWHNFLRHVLRRTDSVTGKVLDVIDEKMLAIMPSDRITAKDLCQQLFAILAASQTEPRAPISQGIMKALLEVDEELLVFHKELKSAPHWQDHREQHLAAGKSRRLDSTLMKTTHRVHYLDSVLNSRIEGHDTYASMADSSPADFVSQRYPPRSKESSSEGHAPSAELGPEYLRGAATLSSTNTLRRSTPGTHKTMNVFQARANIERRRKMSILEKKPKDKTLSKYLGNRDIVIIVDNASSMEDFWDEATFLLETIVLEIKMTRQDGEGIDLFFTCSPIRLQGTTNSSAFTRAMEDPKARPSPTYQTDMASAIDRSLSRAYKLPSRDLTLIILTDGKWKGGLNGVDDLIVGAADALNRFAATTPRRRPLSFQFIQFGDNPEAMYRLRRLDEELPYSGVSHIIDIEHSSGDVNKMLLGSLVETFDMHDVPTPSLIKPMMGGGGDSSALSSRRSLSIFSSVGRSTNTSLSSAPGSTNSLPYGEGGSKKRQK